MIYRIVVNVLINQTLYGLSLHIQVSGFSPTLRTHPSSSSGSAGAPAPPGGGVLAQTVRGDGTYTEHSGFKYCFREVKDGQVSSSGGRLTLIENDLPAL